MPHNFYYGLMRERFNKLTMLTIALLFGLSAAIGIITPATAAGHCDVTVNQGESVNDAILAAGNNKTVCLAAGAIFEWSSTNSDPAELITITNEGITLTTDASNPATLTDNGASFFPVIEIFANGATIENLNLVRNNATSGGQVIASRKSNALIQNNNISGMNNLSPAVTIDHGIPGDYSDTVSNIQLLNNDISGEFAWGFGIRSENGPGVINDVTLTGNVISTNNTGFIFDSNNSGGLNNADISMSGNTFTGSRLFNNTSSTTIDIVRNSIDVSAFTVSTSAGVIDMTCNWWGTANGPDGVLIVSGNGKVTSTPWLTSSNLNGHCVGGLAGPTNAEECRNGGWEGFFLTEERCVSEFEKQQVRSDAPSREQARAGAPTRR